MNNFNFFKKCIYNRIIGGRFSYTYIKNQLNDDEVTRFIKTFCDECPPMKFAGESEAIKHYILKSRWEVIRTISNGIYSLKYRFKLKYIWWTIDELIRIKSDRKYYMNPTPIRKHETYWQLLWS